jgi:DNA-binding SARP family transcriptional activator
MAEIASAEMADEEDASLEIRVLGDFAVLRNGENVRLPPSRKTRALLAYLAVTNHPQHRDRLCSMFWDVPDDPRGALRWSLSKIRQIVNSNRQGALVTDGRMVILRSRSIALDLRRINAISMRDLASQDISELEDVVRLFRGEFLEDLSLPRCPKFEAWRMSWLDDINLFKTRLLQTLIDRLQADASRALPYAHALHALHPQDVGIAAAKEALAERAREQAIKASTFRADSGHMDA